MISYFRIPPPLDSTAPSGEQERSLHANSRPAGRRAPPPSGSDPTSGHRQPGPSSIETRRRGYTREHQSRALERRRREPMSITVRDVRAFKERGERFVMLTAYDYPTARILDEAAIPVVLVGDSVGNNVLGYDTTIPVTMEEMLHHCRAVARAVKEAMVVGDMP